MDATPNNTNTFIPIGGVIIPTSITITKTTPHQIGLYPSSITSYFDQSDKDAVSSDDEVNFMSSVGTGSVILCETLLLHDCP